MYCSTVVPKAMPFLFLAEFDITVTAKLKDPVQKNLRVTLKFFNVDERIELPEEFRRNGADDLSSSGVLQAGLKRKIFSLNIRSARGKPNFGMDPTRPEEIPRPLRFFAQVDWELVNERCPRNLVRDLLPTFPLFTRHCRHSIPFRLHPSGLPHGGSPQ